MADAASAFLTRPKDHLLTPQELRRFQRSFEAQAVRSYLYLSLGIGLLATALPVLLVIAGGLETHDSISSFYHEKVGPARDIMVGTLCAVGVFLFLFHGLSDRENWLLNAAGVAIIAVALVPSPGDTGYGSALIHRGAAIAFFLLIGIVAIFFSKRRIEKIGHARKRRRFKLAYTIAGTAMVALPVIVAALQFVPGGLWSTHWVFFAEWAGIWTFAIYWFVKTAEYRLLLRISWFA